MQMKQKLLIFLAIITYSCTAAALDLVEAYQQGLVNDPIYLQTIASLRSSKQNLPISIASLLPNVAATTSPTITKTHYFNAEEIGITPTATVKYYKLTLSVTQTVFNFAQFSTVGKSLAISRSADAQLNAALQSLMTRVANAYFAILRDEETLSYARASKEAYAKQLDQVRQQYEVGIKTKTDVYTAEASYEASVAQVLAAETTVDNDKENLRVITGHYPERVAGLSDNFPLVSPTPHDIDAWTQKALKHNWSIKAAQENAKSALYQIRTQASGHLPTVQLQGAVDRIYQNNIGGSAPDTGITTNGISIANDKTIALNINFPIFAGGGVVAATTQATYDYDASKQALEKAVRDTVNTTRQSYLGIVSGISQIKADKKAIQSSISSLNGLEEGYRVGTQTLLDVLSQRQTVYENQSNYAKDRYDLLNNILALKQAAGTLSMEDLQAINGWLTITKKQRYNTASKK